MASSWLRPSTLAFALTLSVPMLIVACGDDTTGSGGTGSGAAGPSTGTQNTSSQTGMGGASTTTTTASMMATTSTGPLTCMGQVTTIMGACDLFTQDCPNGGNCLPTLDANNMLSTACSTAGLIGLGQTCADPGECQAGMLCVGGSCTRACCPDSNEPCGVGDCNINATFNGYPNDFIMVCSFSEICTLFDPTSCPNGEDCNFEQTSLATCSPPSGANAMEGEPCQFKNDCADSVICIDNTGPNDQVCRYMCIQGSVAAPGLGGCPAGRTCNTSTYDFGFPNVGYCVP